MSKQSAHKTSRANAPANTLRIIGGQWRGRKLVFPAIDAIRPTPDRVRETVFNWLQHDIVGARCLDLFAGSGALGFEALSRGAGQVVFVDREPRIGQYLRDTLARLDATADVHTADALRFVEAQGQPFDIVFLDPPFAVDVLSFVCPQLEKGGWLAPEALIYIERSTAAGAPALMPGWPGNWRIIKSKTAGQVGYHLARRSIPQT